MRLITVPFAGRTYRSIAYLLLSLPLGIAYFTSLVAGFAVGFGALVALIGVPVLLLTLSLVWAFMRLERHLAGSVLGETIPAPFAVPTQDQSFWSRLAGRLRHPATYTGIAFLLAKLPIGIASFVLTMMAVCVPLWLAMRVATFPFEDARMTVAGFEIDTVQKAMACAVAAPLVVVLVLHLINGAAALSARLARGAVGGSA